MICHCIKMHDVCMYVSDLTWASSCARCCLNHFKGQAKVTDGQMPPPHPFVDGFSYGALLYLLCQTLFMPIKQNFPKLWPSGSC